MSTATHSTGMGRLGRTVPVPEVIVELEALKANFDADVPPTVAEAQDLVEAVRSGLSLSAAAAATGLSEERIVDLVARLGVWISHGFKGRELPVIERGCDRQQLELFALPHPVKRAAQRSTAPVVVLPLGFEQRKQQPRNVKNAYAAIATVLPDSATLTRWIHRTWANSVPQLSRSFVTVIWTFASMGRIEEVADLNPKDRNVVAHTVEAFMLLRASAQAANDALLELLATDPSDLDEFEHLCETASLLHEGDFGRLRNKAIMFRDRPGDEAAAALTKELRWLRQRVEQNPSGYFIDDVGAINAGQLARILDNAGLVSEEENRSRAIEIGKQLTDVGAGADADLLVPLGVAASNAGCDQIFWDAVERRCAGDIDWDLELQDALATA